MIRLGIDWTITTFRKEMGMSTVEKTDSGMLHTVQVRGPNGHRRVFLEGVKPTDTVEGLRARAMSELRLTQEVDWNMRDDGTGQLLREDQTLSELLGSVESQVTLTMQPDAGLG
jgi:hypothetical protein